MYTDDGVKPSLALNKHFTNLFSAELDKFDYFSFFIFIFCNLIFVYFSLLPYNNNIKFLHTLPTLQVLNINTQRTHKSTHSTHDTQRQQQYY